LLLQTASEISEAVCVSESASYAIKVAG
jgi:hypothetical protein